MNKGLFGQPRSNDRHGLNVGDIVVSTDPTSFGTDQFVPINVAVKEAYHKDVLADFGLSYTPGSYGSGNKYKLIMTDNVTIAPARLYIKVR